MRLFVFSLFYKYYAEEFKYRLEFRNKKKNRNERTFENNICCNFALAIWTFTSYQIKYVYEFNCKIGVLFRI